MGLNKRMLYRRAVARLRAVLPDEQALLIVLGHLSRVEHGRRHRQPPPIELLVDMETFYIMRYGYNVKKYLLEFGRKTCQPTN
jgi:hypothetical protein